MTKGQSVLTKEGDGGVCKNIVGPIQLAMWTNCWLAFESLCFHAMVIIPSPASMQLCDRPD